MLTDPLSTQASQTSQPTERPAHHLRRAVTLVVRLSSQGVAGVNVCYKKLPNPLLDRTLLLLARSLLFLLLFIVNLDYLAPRSAFL